MLRDGTGSPVSFFGIAEDVTELKRQRVQLEYLADHDPLTGLLNRRAFERELEQHALVVQRYGASGSVLLIDLDHFKYVNDTLGHRAGDELIARAATQLSSRLRGTDVLARLGGDEFGVLLPKAGREVALTVADSLLQGLREHVLGTAGPARRVTASIGVASFEDAPGLTAEDLLMNADLAMYDAKEDGRDRVAPFAAAERSDTRMRHRITWAHRIQSALADERFELLAQPIVDLSSRQVIRYELLLRMRDEDGELVAPGAFLHIAERLDSIHEIDRWVISNGLQLLSEVDGRADGIAVEINLSGVSIRDAQLLTHIERSLDESGMDPSRLVFEIGASAALESLDRAREFSRRVTELGCRFALDDFGPAFGSFNYLKHLDYDIIKIDGEFVRACTVDQTDQLVISSIVGIARGLGKRTVAEWIADEDTITMLKQLGVDAGQGYHLGLPAPLRDQLGSLPLPR